MDNPPVTVAISRHEQHYACGCTTTRVERVLLPNPDRRHCAAHQGALLITIHTTEFQTQPAGQAWQLHPTD